MGLQNLLLQPYVLILLPVKYFRVLEITIRDDQTGRNSHWLLVRRPILTGSDGNEVESHGTGWDSGVV